MSKLKLKMKAGTVPPPEFTRFEMSVNILVAHVLDIDQTHFKMTAGLKPPIGFQWPTVQVFNRKNGGESKPDVVLIEQLQVGKRLKKDGYFIVVDAKNYNKSSLQSTLDKTKEDMSLRKAFGLIIVGGAKQQSQQLIDDARKGNLWIA